ncbi:MAG: NPCBM/NEW2 domain-containing protein [Verrucomicrobia bacterium]|nr:NPCBM/NEW2 domain-containing protein [Verrucomicrobiota bacterium]
MKFTRSILLTVALGTFLLPVAGVELEFDLQRRNPDTGDVLVTKERVASSKIGVVVVDMWNYHWCKTSTMRVAALVPRMKKVLQAAHDMEMTIFWCPSDVADNYVGTIQHEAAANAPRVPLPALKEIKCPAAPDGGGCTCGKERCPGNYGWDGMHPDLQMFPDDFMPNDLETLYSLCRQRGLSHLIYLGVHTQVCLLGKSIGLRNLSSAGFQCILARDLTDAHGKYDPERGLTPDEFTADVVAHFEKFLAPTINFAAELKKAGQWNDDWIVDPVRLAPWGTPARPHLFEEEVIVTLTAPWQSHATIFYTLDGSEPSTRSPRYSTPLRFSETTRVRAIAFEDGKQVCLPSEGFFARLPAMPPKPNVQLSDLTPLRAVGPGHSLASTEHRFSPVSSPPQRDRSNRGASLRLRGKEYAKGMGVHAPNQLVYELKPEYDRFVALAGVDEHILEVSNGSNLAMHPSVAFKIFIDGKPAAESPVMRIAEQPWRFDVKIPAASKRISVIATDGGNGNKEDLANWVEAGFVLKH